jgi:hypothetical protein
VSATTWPDFGSYITPGRAAVVRRQLANYGDAVPQLQTPHAAGPVLYAGPAATCANAGGAISEHDAAVIREFAEFLKKEPPAEPAAAPVTLRPSVARPCSLCGTCPARLYVPGWRCADCAPPAPPTPDPSTTATALHERRWRLIRAMGATA